MKVPPKFPNVICWNTNDRPKVMNTVALRVNKAVFQATHFPSPIRILNYETNSSMRYDEQQLLKDFLDQRCEHRFCAAVGDSGTGKSHLIRWMYNSTREAIYHSVLIPRDCANLADVLYCILRDFEGEEIDRIRKEIQWTNNISIRGAMTKILDELAFVLEPENITTSNLSFPNDEEHEIILESMPAFLRSDSIRQKLMEDKDNGIVVRLARHISATEREKRPDDEEELKWKVEDVIVDASTAEKAGEKAGELAATLLTDSDLSSLSAQILNQATSKALANLLGLRHGNLLRALSEIRRALKNENKQLLLFLEDLSITQGVDAELIESLLISTEDAGADLCILRSIIGLTNDDFARLRENIKGRIDITVNFDLTIGEKNKNGSFGQDELVDFASRYLNASRYSIEEMENFLTTKSYGDYPSFCDQVKCPNISLCHKTFGEVNGRGLYPFTPESIVRLYIDYTKSPSNEPQAFNPRKLISRIINRVLEDGESNLEYKNFPSPRMLEWFKLSSVGVNIQQELYEKYGEKTADKIRTALEIYSKNPTKPSLPSGIIQAFDFPKLSKIEITPDVHTTPKITENVGININTSVDIFDNWVNKKSVEDKDINIWRKAVYEAICSSYDWDSDTYGWFFYQFFQRSNIHFDGQHTKTKGGDIRLEIDASPKNALAIRGLVNGFGKDHKNLVFIFDFVDRCTSEVHHKIRKLAKTSGKHKPLEITTRLLSLGVLLRQKWPSEPVSQDLLLNISKTPKESIVFDDLRSASWKGLLKAYEQYGEKIIEECIFDVLTCRKGKSKETKMIDVSPILQELDASLQRIQPYKLPEQSKDWYKRTYGNLITFAKQVEKYFDKAIEEEVERCQKWLDQTLEYTGTLSIKSISEELSEALNLGIEADIFSNPKVIEISKRLKILEQVDKQIQLARKVIRGNSLIQRIQAIVSLDYTIMKESLDILNSSEQILKDGIKNLQQNLDDEGIEDPIVWKKKISQKLQELDEDLEKLEE
ncbi:protein DpdH [Candidatus Uabimicrobium amorphum]|uniref:Uncharacterized protein n=1 Tax=Uabimicrobium amorphum TaxID=2596890 RepID=A0A5S9F5Y4_UABAM|nr:protein DpdH [Candidatus Uabimicrobium amorphum]BBM87122.1 hypothetical protein UABAM_05525 [Candidatus Uabimicrobium amorphum]